MDNNEQYPQYDNGQYYQDTTGYDPYQQYNDTNYAQYDYSGYQQYDNTYEQYDNTGYGQYDNTYGQYDNSGCGQYNNSYPQYNDPYQQYGNAGYQPYDPYEAAAHRSPYTFTRPTGTVPQFTPYEKPFKRRPWVTVVVLLVLAAVVGLVSFYFVYRNGTRRSISGLPDPVQTQAEGGTSMSVDGYDIDITFKYAYSVDALVVHTKDYSGGSKINDQISPVDLGLAWGTVAATNEDIDYHWDQSGRWIYWEIDTGSEIARAGGKDQLNSHCSNNHIIPATSDVEKTVTKMRRGDHVKLEGYLVDVYGKKPDGTWFSWNSSTSRTDTGNGACEVFYVTSATIVD